MGANRKNIMHVVQRSASIPFNVVFPNTFEWHEWIEETTMYKLVNNDLFQQAALNFSETI